MPGLSWAFGAAPYFSANFLEQPLSLALCLAHDQHRLALGLLLRLLAQLLRRDEGVIQRAIALPEGERRRMLESVRASVRSHDLDSWAERELAELAERAPARVA